MTVNVLFFSVLRDLTHSAQLDLESPTGSSLGHAVALLSARYPSLAGWQGRLLLAVNGEFANLSTPLNDGDEVALMPPVQGG